MTPAELAAAAGEMAAILEREPELSDFGFGVFGPRKWRVLQFLRIAANFYGEAPRSPIHGTNT
jgi:hypothetical protein